MVSLGNFNVPFRSRNSEKIELDSTKKAHCPKSIHISFFFSHTQTHIHNHHFFQRKMGFSKYALIFLGLDYFAYTIWINLFVNLEFLWLLSFSWNEKRLANDSIRRTYLRQQWQPRNGWVDFPTAHSSHLPRATPFFFVHSARHYGFAATIVLTHLCARRAKQFCV